MTKITVLECIRQQRKEFYADQSNSKTKLVILLTIPELQDLMTEIGIGRYPFGELLALLKGDIKRVHICGVFVEIGTPKEAFKELKKNFA